MPFMINKDRKPTSFEIVEYVISATLSSFKSGTWFYTRGGRTLREYLYEIYNEIDLPILKENLYSSAMKKVFTPKR